MKLPAFSDVQEAMDAAANDARGCRVRFDNYRAAVAFRHRCHTFRSKQRKLSAEVNRIPGMAVSTIYDSLELTIRDDSGRTLKAAPLEPSAYFDVMLQHRQQLGTILQIDSDEPYRPDNFELDL